MSEHVTDLRTGAKLCRSYLGSVLHGRLELRPCLRSAGAIDLIWRGSRGVDPLRAVDDNLNRLIAVCWRLMSMRTARRLRGQPFPLGDGRSWLLCRLAPGRYQIEPGDSGGEQLYECHVVEPPRKKITRPC